MNWEEYYDKNRFLYPVKPSCRNITTFDIGRVYPLQQDNVKTTYDVVKHCCGVKRVIVFGSSITMKCNEQSDLDLCIEMLDPDNHELKNNVANSIRDAVDCDVDILWRENLDNTCPVLVDIRKGLVIYEQFSKES